MSKLTPEAIFDLMTTNLPEGVVYRRDANEVPAPIEQMRQHAKSCQIAFQYDIGPVSNGPPWSPSVRVSIRANGKFQIEPFGEVSERTLALFTTFFQTVAERLRYIGPLQDRL